MKAILLVRVSTLIQDYTAQREDLIAYAKRLGFTDYHVIEDKESAIKLSEEERNGLNCMKDWIKNNPEYRTVIVWEISRLARSEKVLHSIKDYFLQNHIQLYIYDKQYKLFNDDGSENQETGLLFSLYAYFAEQEMKQKKERFKRAKRLNAQLGKYNGGYIPFGYKLDEKKYVVPDEENAKIVKDIFLAYATGNYSIHTLKQYLKDNRIIDIKEFSLAKVLGFTGYIGYTECNNVVRKYIPILDKELFFKVQTIKSMNVIGADKSKRYYLGTKIFKCPKCGSYYMYRGKSYSCSHAFTKIYEDKECSYTVGISSKWADVLLWYISCREHKNFLNVDVEDRIEAIFKEIKMLMRKTIVKQNEINKIKKKYDRINMLFINMKIEEDKYHELELEIDKEKKTKQEELDVIDAEISSKQITLEELEKGSKDVISDDITMKEMKELVKKYIKKAYVYREVVDKGERLRIVVYFNKYHLDGKITDAVEEYYFYSFQRKRKFEFNDEVMDDKIKEMIGNAFNTIMEYKRI